MSKANPRKAVAAILPLDLETPGGLVVRPMTLGMWAALERIASPLVTGVDAKDALDLVPSLYLVTHDPREVLRGDFFAAALAWADTVPVSAMEEIRRAAARQANAMFDVVPETTKKKTAVTTAGSRTGSTGAPASTAGGSTISSGASRQARSRCSEGSLGLRPGRSSRSPK